MRERFEQQLIELNNAMIEMGTMIEKAIEKAITALVQQNVEMAQAAIEADADIDRQEKEIENLCLKLLLMQQPVARDLRQVSAALKMITDMERIGDHAADISEITILMAGQPYIKKLELLQQMAKETMLMLVQCIEAYVNKDMEKAKAVIDHDDVIDDLFLRIKKELIDLIGVDPKNGEQAADFLMVAKYFERIGDHATNISEWVIFSIAGKHGGEEITIE
ncbi:MAG: phosphate signaling complex protein PhoU [Lachnospiraceae bacterium]|nr:phosphate signaling complex protein PhoU [Lachnospiraceae bacterium]